MRNEKTINVKIRRIDLCKLLIATTSLQFACLQESKQTEDKQIKASKIRSGKTWERLHDLLEEQLSAFDEKHVDNKD